MLMQNLFEEDFLNRMFDDFTRPVKSAAKGHGFANMPQVLPQFQLPSMRTDIKTVDGGYEFTVELPGYNKDEITAELNDGYLKIVAKKETNVEEADPDDEGKYIRRERYYGCCKRSFYVGDEVTQNDIKAKFDNGILELFVPKIEKEVEEEEKQYINID